MEMAAVPNLMPALPEIILALGAMVLLMFGVFRGNDSADTISLSAVLLFAIAAIVILFGPQGEQVTFNGAFIVDDFARFLKIITLIGSAVTLIMARHWLAAEQFHRFEFGVLVVLATLGMMMMISANGLIALYLGIEMQSLSLYVAAALQRDSLRSTEAGLKYFVLGALSSGILLYGCSLIYGFTGSTQFPDIAASVASQGVSLGLLFGLVFLMAGLAFKISAVPFHMWTPDVYEGAPTPVTAFFAAAPKVAAMAMFARALVAGFPGATDQWQQVVVFIAIASMILGAFAAIGQNNIKRLMAYSSIGHMGFALVGLAAGTAGGIKGLVIYMTIYMIMSLGAFACILAMRRDGEPVEEIADLAGLAQTDRMMAVLLAALLFSLAGIPPLAGFFAKFYVFLAAIEAGLVTLAVLGVLASVVGAYYYLRIIKIMFFDDPDGVLDPMPSSLAIVLGVSAAFVIVFVAWPGPLVTAAQAAADALF